VPNNDIHKFSLRAMPSEKKLFIVDGDKHSIVPYDFSFVFENTTHFMCFKCDTVFVLAPNNRVRKSYIKLYANDVLMVMEEGHYDYIKVRPCEVRNAWFKAYSDWLAEKEILKVANKKAKYIEPDKPMRPHDHISKRGVPYWWAPEWVRDLNGTMTRVKPIKDKKGGVDLHMLSKAGKLSYIQGSIQQEFKQWHEDRAIDYLLLGVDPDELIETTHDK